MIRLFDKDKDYNTIMKWWLDHDQIPCAVNLLPNIGFIVDELVVGFLYQTDSSVCFIECVVSDKNSDKEKRQKALIELGNMLIDTAKEMKFKKAYFHSRHPSIIENGLSHWGFTNCLNSIERFERIL